MTMYTLDNFLASVRHETAILHHLHGKLSVDQLDFRPAEGMRSTLELLRYLSICGIATAEGLIEGHWSLYREREAAAAELASKEIPAALDRQLAELEALVAGLSASDLERQVETPGGGSGPLGVALINHPLRYLAAYRLQLFTYAKASGTAGLSTYNAWGGRDKPES